MRRFPGLVAAAVLAAATMSFTTASPSKAVSCPYPSSTLCYAYAGIRSQYPAGGVDGVIHANASTLNPAYHVHVANWMGVQDSYMTVHEWLQVGVIQRCAAGKCDSTPHVYIENRPRCGSYSMRELGTPPSSGAYYIWTDGQMILTTNGCGYQYVWHVRIGSWTSGATYDYTMANPSAYVEVLTELEYSINSPTAPSSGKTYFGCTASGSCSASAGLHLYYNGWRSWTASLDGLKEPPTSNQPPYYHGVLSYYSFYTTGS